VKERELEIFLNTFLMSFFLFWSIDGWLGAKTCLLAYLGNAKVIHPVATYYMISEQYLVFL